MRILTAVVHVLDKDSGNVVLSHKDMDPNDIVIQEYLQKVVQKFVNSEYTETTLDDCPIVQSLVNDPDTFMEQTTQISLDFFEG